MSHSVFDSGVTAYGAGDGVACALHHERLMCWGQHFGVLGAEVALEAPVTELVVGAAHACVRLGNGALACMGDNTQGQLGTPPDPYAQRARVVTGVSGATAIAVGGRHACAIVDAGRVMCWGDNASVQLGRFPDDSTAGIVAERGPGFVRLVDRARSLYAAGNETCAARDDGALICWGASAGWGDTVQLIAESGIHPTWWATWWSRVGAGDELIRLGTATGAFHVRSRSFWEPGEQRLPPLEGGFVADAVGYGAGAVCRLHAGVLVCEANDEAIPVTAPRGLLELVGEGSTLCVVGEDGLACTPSDSVRPRPIVFQLVPDTRGIRGIDIGADVVCGVVPGQGVTCASQGRGPTLVPGTERAVAVNVGGHGCALLDDGTVACFGDNTWGGVAPDDGSARIARMVTFP